MALINSDVIPASATAYEIEQSLRFNDDDSAYLSWTPSSAGNRKTWTWSGWVKRGNLGLNTDIFTARHSSSTLFLALRFASNNTIQCNDYQGSDSIQVETSAVFRDTSSWYHILVKCDTTQATDTNRFKVYVNGTEQTLTGTLPPQNYDTYINTTQQHRLGHFYNTTRYLDGYLSEVNFIDGQALDPTDFGETGTYGEWKPIEYTGTYGTNGFYLPFKNDYEVEGFSTVTWTGTGSTQYIGGTGFQPDFVWIKNRSHSNNHSLYDAVRGAKNLLISNTTDANQTDSTGLLSFDSDGFSVGTASRVNSSGRTYVAWSWDMGGSSVSNTDGSITSTVRANPTYGQSIVSYTGTGSNATVGHGLTQPPELILTKARNLTSNWLVYNSTINASNGIRLNTAGASSSAPWWNYTSPTSSVFTVAGISTTGGSGNQNIAYCFHSVTGYSKIGSYTSGSTPFSVTTGFRPAFVMVKNTDTGSSGWVIKDSTRNPDSDKSQFKALQAQSSNAEDTAASGIKFTDTGFEITASGTSINNGSDVFIYMAFADKREFAYWLDQSGNNNDWTSNNLTESDIAVDSPTNNFATWNTLAKSTAITLSEGSLKSYKSSNSNTHKAKSTIGTSSGKWYAEFLSLGILGGFGIIDKNGTIQTSSDSEPNSPNSFTYHEGGKLYTDNDNQTTGYSTFSSGDIIGVGLDADNNQCKFYKNNSLEITASIDSGLEWFFTVHMYGGTAVANFGQDSSFAGNKTAQGNTDSNNKGDFYYTPPSGYLALCTANLPDPDVIPSENFNTVLYTGTGSSQSITGVGFQPDFTWLKARSNAQNHTLYDAVRGVENYLISNSTGAEVNNDGTLTSFNSDGFSLGSAFPNDNGYTYAAWNWKANGSGVSNTDGSITSTVSANHDAGFSIVSYTGNGTSGATVGHGLSSKPAMIIVKKRNGAEQWGVGTDERGYGSKLMFLESTSAEVNNSSVLQSGTNSTTIQVGADGISNANGDTYIAYCFSNIDGFSKVGSYTGNGSTDGTFVYTGFRPAFIMWKRYDVGDDWIILDNKRDIDNLATQDLRANLSGAEQTADRFDMVSNGFKWRATWNDSNTSGGDYIYIAFAETPFKYSNAR